MKPDNPFINWVDVLIVVLLLLGIVRGRRRGISEELLDVIKWGVIVVACAFLYEPAGVFLAQNSVFSLLSCFVAMYAMIALLILLLFSFIRRSVGQKLVSSDAFGPTEYYLGMVAGMARYACVILVAMAILNARYFSPGEIGSQTKYQEDNFGTKLFPTLSGVQHETFARSTGKNLPASTSIRSGRFFIVSAATRGAMSSASSGNTRTSPLSKPFAAWPSARIFPWTTTATPPNAKGFTSKKRSGKFTSKAPSAGKTPWRPTPRARSRAIISASAGYRPRP